MSNIYSAKGINLVKQYEDVGHLFKKQLNKDIDIEPKKLKIVEAVLENVRKNKSLDVFYNCFAAWARGAGISEQKAMYLLADNTSGCQTAIVRYGSGVALLHTEEDYYDIKSRLGNKHTIEFREGKRSLKCLTYNDLMPGAGLYGWQKDMVVAVDSLFLREEGIDKIKQPMLANIIAWLIWYEEPSRAEPDALVARLKELGTVVDGYAINVVRKTDSEIQGYKLTFARKSWEVEWLGGEPGANLRQVNIIEPAYSRAKKEVAKYRHAPWRMGVDYYGFLKRLREMKQHLDEHRNYFHLSLPPAKLTEVHQAIQRLVFEKYAKEYVTEWMGAMCVGLVDKTGLSVSTKLNDDGGLEELAYLDIVQ